MSRITSKAEVMQRTTITSPDLVATFLVQLRDGMGQEIERVEAVRITPALSVSHDSGADREALRVMFAMVLEHRHS